MQAVDASVTATAYLVGAHGRLGGARLLAGATAATAILREGTGSGRILAALGAGAGLPDEFMPSDGIPYAGAVFVTLTGTSPILTLYQK
jgi:hypothetical protein